jgi:hypothetical protein
MMTLIAAGKASVTPMTNTIIKLASGCRNNRPKAPSDVLA